MKQFSIIFLLSVIFASCSGSSGDGDNSGSGESGPAEEGVVSEEERRIVLGSMISGLNLGVETPTPDFPAPLNLERPQNLYCPMIRDFYNNYGSGACAHSCEGDHVFQRDCSGERVSAECDGQGHTVTYTNYTMDWDMSGLNESGQGVSIFRLNASGQAQGDGIQNVSFDCEMFIRARTQGGLEELSCGNDFNITCSINGSSQNCEQLLSAANESRGCSESD